jgi:hypothetical protein
MPGDVTAADAAVERAGEPGGPTMSEPRREKPAAYELDLSGAEWQRAEESEGEEEAIEIAFVEEYIAMRNSAEPEGTILVFTQAEWDAFVLGAKDGEFDFDDE